MKKLKINKEYAAAIDKFFNPTALPFKRNKILIQIVPKSSFALQNFSELCANIV